MKKLPCANRETFLYLLFGGLTTIIGVILYYAFAHVAGFGTVLSNSISWVVSVLFAFVTNKIWVFESAKLSLPLLMREIGSFYLCRVMTGLFDLVVMYVCVDLYKLNDLPVKCVSTCLVVILNYIASKWIIFNLNIKKRGKES